MNLHLRNIHSICATAASPSIYSGVVFNMADTAPLDPSASISASAPNGADVADVEMKEEPNPETVGDRPSSPLSSQSLAAGASIPHHTLILIPRQQYLLRPP